MNRILVLTALALTIDRGLISSAAEPANPEANPKACAILNYIESLPQRTDKRLISGQFSDFGQGAKLGACQEAFAKTGHWPAMIGLDYVDAGKGSISTKAVNRLAIDYARQGGLIKFSAHLPNPANPRGGGLRDQGVNIKELLEHGTATHQR